MSAPDEQLDPLQIVDRACHGPFREAVGKLEGKIASGILSVLERIREMHRELVIEAGLDGAAPDDHGERAARLLEYRRRVAAEVLTPLSLGFRGSGHLRAAVTSLKEALTEATEGARALPRKLSAPWPPSALQPRDSDALGRRVRKSLARVFSAARKAGEIRDVPLRAVALHHLDETLAPGIDGATVEALTAWAAWERSLEGAWMEWSDEALPALVQAELPGEEDEAEGEHAALWPVIAEAAERFDETLGSLIDTIPLSELVQGLDRSMGRAHGVLESDLAVAGSLVFTPEGTHRLDPGLERLESMRPSLEAWEDAVDNRLHLYEAVLGILAGASAVQRRLVLRVREEQLSATSVLSDIAVELETLAEELSAGGDPQSDVRRRLEDVERRVQSILEPAEAAVPSSTDVSRAIETGADATVDALTAMVRQAPGSLELHPEEGRLPAPGRKPETRVVALQDLARQSFDALRIERIRSSAGNLVGALDQVRADVEELPNVFAFAFDAADNELEQGEEDAEAKAVELVTEALLSMAESLRNARRSVDTAVRKAQARLTSEVTDGSRGLLERVAAGRMQARLLAARSGIAELVARVDDRLGPPVRRALRSATARWKILRRWASRGLRKGSEMVAAPAAGSEAASRTLRQLSNARTVLDQFPLVYQRLFTLQPIGDPSLLAGRQSELADGMTRWKRWRGAEGVPLIVRGRPGSGITSFLSVLGAKITEDDGKLAEISLDHRIQGEEDLARRLSTEIGVKEVDSLDDLATAVFEASRGDVPDAVILDNLEHLYLRVPKGTDLIERLLTLMAETEPRIFWIGGVTTSAWQLISSAEPTAVSQVEVLELGQLTGSAFREAMTIRHRRSGLPLRFEEPEGRRRRLRQRLKRLRDRDAYEDVLATDFFDQLERTSARHLRLAFFQWLLAADFDEGEGVLMRMPQRPDFSVLESLALTQNFTLKAFLEHRTLSLKEHDRVFRLPRHESYQIFESLQNRHLIEPVVSDGDGSPQRSEIEEDLRYRVRPLVVGAVITHLRGRNIFH